MGSSSRLNQAAEDPVHGLLAADQLLRFQNLQGHFAVLPHIAEAVGDLQPLLFGQRLQIVRIADIEVQVIVVHRLLPLVHIVLLCVGWAVSLLDNTVGGVDRQALADQGLLSSDASKTCFQGPTTDGPVRGS